MICKSFTYIFLKQHQPSTDEKKSLEEAEEVTSDLQLGPDEELIRLLDNTGDSVSGAQETWHVKDELEDTSKEEEAEQSNDGDSVVTQVPPEPEEEPKQRRWPKHKVEDNSRRFNLDLTPR